MKKYELDKYREKIEFLYIKEKLSCKKISEILGCSLCGIYDALKRWEIKTRNSAESHKIYICKDDFFDEIDTEIKAYWLGFIYADGYITGNKLGIALSSIDVNHIEKFSQHIKTTYPIKEYQSKSKYGNCNYSRILINSKKLVREIKLKGVMERKSLILKFPEKEILNQKLWRHFIRGYFDGDGSLILSENSINFKICGTKEMLNGIVLALNKNINQNFRYKFYKRKIDDKNSFYLSYGGRRKTFAVMDYLYKDSQIYLDRKYEKYILLKNSINKI